MFRSVKWGITILLVLFALKLLTNPFYGKSDFSTTTFYYFLALFGILTLLYYKKINLSSPLLIVLSLVVSFYLAEIALRYVVKYPITYSERQWGMYRTLYDSPNNRISLFQRLFGNPENLHLCVENAYEVRDYKANEFDYQSERTNEYGLRGKLPSKNRKVIVALGDSFTESFGAPADSTYPLLLETYISTQDTLVEILNGGMSGSDPFFEFQLLKALAERYRFDAAVFMVNNSDINDVMMKGGAERFLPNGDLQYRKGAWWEPIYAVSFVCRLFLHELFGYNYSLMTQKQEEAETFNAINSIANYFDSVVLPWAASKNIKIYVVLQPSRYEITNPPAVYNELSRQLSSLPTNYFNLADSFQKLPHLDKYYWKEDGHFNSKGYELTARFIGETFF